MKNVKQNVGAATLALLGSCGNPEPEPVAVDTRTKLTNDYTDEIYTARRDEGIEAAVGKFNALNNPFQGDVYDRICEIAQSQDAKQPPMQYLREKIIADAIEKLQPALETQVDVLAPGTSLQSHAFTETTRRVATNQAEVFKTYNMLPKRLREDVQSTLASSVTVGETDPALLLGTAALINVLRDPPRTGCAKCH